MALGIDSKKILIAEDDNFLRGMYQSKLEMEGFLVDSAENGKQALKAVEKNPPDLILLDILMPVMNGFEFLRQLQASKKYRKIPVILLTNLSGKEDVDKGIQLGAKDYLVKVHFTPEEVIKKIKEHI
ncbi:MAG: hypothetical protein A3F54_00650 [Candidatus Kerfeldbacteria bacterium RIFCSPHIGHO2_12_FULL_48_17]|uniref:Response regulatory domain-containing protein n=1 Tax=Candidatus Kerfeldbacteria bacterium RIFCSPHIGHO2_12_FULL_48_17 TaxID=1798542 RepID=A0A1G2B5H2_9BACT|nr:MAG: hypothetical protein A3F54_00650 [Candidatus Kerfeldbacteria bacterium RIFCSPHIGHO2_12_FULL_48_17]